MTKHEYSAWWRFASSGLVGACLFWWLFFSDRTAARDGWESLHDALNILLVLALVLDASLRRRKAIAQDERDRTISAIAAPSALVALGIVVLTTPIIPGLAT